MSTSSTTCCPSPAPWPILQTPVCPPLAAAFFVIRNKANIRYRRRYSRPVDNATGLRCDQTIVLTGTQTADRYPQPLRRIKYRDPQTHTTFEFLTNHFTLHRYRGGVDCRLTTETVQIRRDYHLIAMIHILYIKRSNILNQLLFCTIYVSCT